MTTAQRLAMTQLFEGEIVNDTTLGQSMIYHASTGWQVLPGGGGGDTLNALKSNLTATTPMLLTNVCWGDSLTYGNAPTYTPYGQWLQQITGIPFMNMGIPGASSTAILTNFQHYPQYWGLPTIIWSGYNNGSDTNTVLSDIATMVGDLTTTNWLVLGLIITTNGQGIGTATYTNNQLVLNAVLSARYTNHFVDVLGYLRNVAWLTNAADYYTYTNGSPAARLHFDNSVHLNSEGYSYVADAILQSGMFGLSNQVPTVGNTYRILNDFAAYPPMFGYGAPNLGVFSQLDIGANSNAVFYIGGDGSLTLYNANASAAFEPIPAATLGEQFWPWTSLWLPNRVNIGVTGDGSIGFSGMPSILGVGANIGEAGYSWNIAYLRDMELTNASGSNADIYTGADGSLVIANAPALISTTKGALGETGWGWSQLVFAPSNIIVSPVTDGSLFIFDAGMPVLGFNGGILGEASQPWSGGFFTNVVTNTGGSGIGIDFAGTGFHGNGSWLTSLHTFNTPSSNSMATVAAAVNTAAGWVTAAITNTLAPTNSPTLGGTVTLNGTLAGSALAAITNGIPSTNGASTGGQGYALTNNAGVVSWVAIPPSGGGSQTPWTSDISGGGHMLTNASMILQSNATGSVALTNGNVVLSGSIIGTGAGPAIFSSGIDLSNTFLMTVNQTNAASGQVLTATDGSGHVAFQPATGGSQTPWTSDVSGGGHMLTNAGMILQSNATGTVALTNGQVIASAGLVLGASATNNITNNLPAPVSTLVSGGAVNISISSITNIVIVTNQSTILFHTNNPFPVGNLTTGSGIAWTNLATAGAGFLCEGDVTFTNSQPTDVIQMMITWNSTFKFTNFCNCTTNSGHGGTNSFHIPLSDTNSIIGITNTGPNTIYVSASHIFGHP